MNRTIKLITVKEAAQELNESAGNVLGFIQEGKLSAMKMDNRVLISEMQVRYFSLRHGAGYRESSPS